MSKITLGIKIRLYPDEEQKEQTTKAFGCCRYVYNHYLEVRRDLYNYFREEINYYDCANDITSHGTVIRNSGKNATSDFCEALADIP